MWASAIQTMAKDLASSGPDVTFTWSPDGLDIHIPEDRLTMDMAMKLEQTLKRILGAGES